MAKADTLPESDEICNGVASDSCHEQEGVRRLNTHLHRGSSEVEGEEVYNFNVRGGERRHQGEPKSTWFLHGAIKEEVGNGEVHVVEDELLEFRKQYLVVHP